LSKAKGALAQFAQDWDARLNQGGRATVQFGALQGEIAAPYVVADRFVQMLGYHTSRVRRSPMWRRPCKAI